VRRRPRAGATFILELPLARPAALDMPHSVQQEQRAHQRAERPRRPAEVLLVEDSPADVQIEIKLMKREKVKLNLHIANNGRDAMRLLEERAIGGRDPPIDLMLLDINMPIMDGFEVLSALSANGRLNRMPVCVLSTSSDEDDRQRAKALGARAYMVKPPTLRQLELALKGIDTLDLQPREDALILCAEQQRHTPSATA
jgi:CheY-like chemotaxis protein